MKTVLKLIRRTFGGFIEDKGTVFAAALSFYTMVSLAPLLVIALWVLGEIYGERAVKGEITNQIASVVGEDAASVIESVLANADRPGSDAAAIISILVMMVSGSAVFSQLQHAFNAIWNHVPKKTGLLGFAINRAIAVVMVIGFGVFAFASLALSTAVSAVTKAAKEMTPGIAYSGRAIDSVVTFLVFFIVFMILFKTMSGFKIRGHPLAVGALVTSLLFTFGRIGVGLYLGRSAVASAYGAAGSVLVLLIWIYYSALVTLLGAEFTQAYSQHRGSPIRAARRRKNAGDRKGKPAGDGEGDGAGGESAG